MKSKYFFMIITIFCIAMLISMPTVKAETSSSLEREMAIACALAYLPLEEGGNIGLNKKLVGSKIAQGYKFLAGKIKGMNGSEVYDNTANIASKTLGAGAGVGVGVGAGVAATAAEAFAPPALFR